MKKEINLRQTDVEFIVPQKEHSEGKRWSYSFVYYLEDLRNVYRLYDEFEIDSIPTLYRKCKELGVRSWNGKAWNQRNLLELVNALKNFQLLSVDGNDVAHKGLFAETQPEDPLVEDEKRVFKEIYLSYFRFCEFHELFCVERAFYNNNSLYDSKSVIYYMQESRFTNRFILSTTPQKQIVGIPDEHSDMMRFWDVYIKWGLSLNMLRKYPLKPFGINTVPPTKGLSIAYFFCEMPKDFSVFEYILSDMQGSYLFIPDVIYSLIVNRRYAVEDIIERIVDESISNPNVFRAQSTSAIFINEKESFLFPKIGNTYITHLLKL